jgi:hypothetical protein
MKQIKEIFIVWIYPQNYLTVLINMPTVRRRLAATLPFLFIVPGFRPLERELNTYCNVDGQSVAKQRLSKQTSTIERLFSMGSAPRQLLRNGLVNTFQQWKTVFSVGSVQRSYLKNKRRYGSVLSSDF